MFYNITNPLFLRPHSIRQQRSLNHHLALQMFAAALCTAAMSPFKKEF